MSTWEKRSSLKRVSKNVLEVVEILRGEKKDTSSSADDDEYCKPWYSKKITKKIAKCSVAGGAVVAIGGLCYKGRRRLLNAANEKQFLEAVKAFTEKCPQHFIDFVKNCNENEACYQDELDGQKLRIDDNACFIYQDNVGGVRHLDHEDDISNHVGVSAVNLNSSQSRRFVDTRTNHYNWDEPEKTKFESFRVLTSHMELKSFLESGRILDRCWETAKLMGFRETGRTLDRCWESASPKTFAPDGTYVPVTRTSDTVWIDVYLEEKYGIRVDTVWNHVYLEEKYADFKKYLKAAEDFWSLNE